MFTRPNPSVFANDVFVISETPKSKKQTAEYRENNDLNNICALQNRGDKKPAADTPQVSKSVID
jgi:hypothetical protein